MAQKKVKTRIQNKIDTKENWATANTKNFKPLKGEIILYQDPMSYCHTGGSLPLIKIGDGDAKVEQLPFLNLDKLVVDDGGSLNAGVDRYYVLRGQAAVAGSGAPYHLHTLQLPKFGDSSKSVLDGLPDGAHIKQTCLLHLDGCKDPTTLNNYGRSFPVYIEIVKRSGDSLKLFILPDRCLSAHWTLADTVSNSAPEYTIRETSDTVDSVQFSVTLPEDKNQDGSYKCFSGLAYVDIDIFKVTSDNLYITISPRLCVGN